MPRFVTLLAATKAPPDSWIAALFISLACVGCERIGSDDAPQTNEARHEALARALDVPTAGSASANISTRLPRARLLAPRAQLSKVATALNRWSMELYGRLDKRGNVCVAPFGVATALAVLRLGARSDTARLLEQRLGFPMPVQEFHNAFGALIGRLARDTDAPAPDRYRSAHVSQDASQLTVASSVWLAPRYPIADEFVRDATKYYRAKFESAPPWRATDSLLEMTIDNRVSFRGIWASPFPTELTHPEPFYVRRRERLLVPMMHNVSVLGYREDARAQIVWLPYVSNLEAAGAPLEMVIVVPKARFGLAELEERLDWRRFQRWAGGTRDRRRDTAIVRLSLPRFAFASQREMTAPLIELGLAPLLNEQADFRGISKKRPLFLTSAIHAAVLAVDELGTTATAVTELGLIGAGRPIKRRTVTVRAHHPFLFAIWAPADGVILFIGRVASPAPQGSHSRS